MKKLLFLLLLIPAVSFGQNTFYVRQDTAQVKDRAYAASMVDTCQAFSANDYKEVWLTLQSTDTASIHVKAFLSADGVTYAPLSAAFDSLSVAAASGGLRTVDIKSTVGNNYVKFVFNQTAFRVPVAGTHLYTAKVTLLK